MGTCLDGDVVVAVEWSSRVFARFEESTEIDRPSLRRQPFTTVSLHYIEMMPDVFRSMPSGSVTAKEID